MDSFRRKKEKKELGPSTGADPGRPSSCDAEAGAGISKEWAKTRGGPRPALHVPDVDDAGSHRPHDLDPTAPGHLLDRDDGGFPATNTRATVHGFKRDWARWTRKREGYLRVVGELKWRRCFGRVSGGAPRR